MRPLAVTGVKRHPLLPDVPTFEELGYKGFDGVQWYGIVGPANLPAPIVKLLSARDQQAAREPRAARAPRRRSARADADVGRGVRPLHARRHRALDPHLRRNATLPSPTDPPPVTRLLADFVATHPSRGWDDRRRARGAPHLPELGRLRRRRVAPRGGRSRARGRAGARAGAAGVAPGSQRARRRRERRARQRHRVAHLRLRRHAPRHDHPSGRSRRVGGAGAGRAPRRLGPAADRCARDRHRRRVPRRQRDLSRPLRPRVAHHRLDRNARRRRGLRAPPRSRRAAHDHGARHRRVAADRRPRAVRLDDEAVSRRRRGARGSHLGADGATWLYRLGPRARSAARPHADVSRPSATGRRSRTSSARASRSRSTRTSRSPAAS